MVLSPGSLGLLIKFSSLAGHQQGLLRNLPWLSWSFLPHTQQWKSNYGHISDLAGFSDVRCHMRPNSIASMCSSQLRNVAVSVKSPTVVHLEFCQLLARPTYTLSADIP